VTLKKHPDFEKNMELFRKTQEENIKFSAAHKKEEGETEVTKGE
jgi:hypothetical protein